MTNRKTILVSVDALLDLVHCAETYGFADDVFLYAVAEFLDFECSDAEIKACADKFLQAEMIEQGYGDADYEDAIDRLTEWRDRYCESEKVMPAQ